jgi:hypothetical protein
MSYTANSLDTNSTGFSSLAKQKRTAAQSGFFVRIAFARLFQWAGLGGGAYGLAGFFCCRSANPTSCPLTPFSSGQRAFIQTEGGRTMRQAPAHPEQTPSSLELIQNALRAAALAPTVYDALDLTGEALRRLAEAMRAEAQERAA